MAKLPPFLINDQGVPFHEPVRADDGFVYEKTQLDNWFISHNTSPKNGTCISKRYIVVKQYVDLISKLTPMQLNIQMNSSFIHPIEAFANTTVEELKKIIRDEICIPVSQQQLFYRGSSLSNNASSLSSCGILTGQTVLLIRNCDIGVDDSSVLTRKVCPKCHMKAEKYNGCNYMTCLKCGSHWCWQCNSGQSPLFSSESSFQSCHKH